MKRIILALAFCGAVGLGGCAELDNIGTGVSIATASITNPVTKTKEAQIELAIDAAITVLNGYRTACIQHTADKNCRANIVAIQRYTRQMPPLIAQLRGFVDNDQQLNAIAVYNQLINLYSNFKTSAANLGYNVGELP